MLMDWQYNPTTASNTIQDDEIAVWNMKHLEQACEDIKTSLNEIVKIMKCNPELLLHCIRNPEETQVKMYEELTEIVGWEEYVSGRHKSFQEEELPVDTAQDADDSDSENTVETMAEDSQHRRHDDIKTYVRFTQKRRNELEVVATLEKTTMSDLINMLVDKYLDSYTYTKEAVIEAILSLNKKKNNNDALRLAENE